ncbi:sigma 54-interacting transcriptional regulator [Nitrospirillum iridis]|uniref:Two-component system nitrogen regulation response regulator GlnG n=1 Tax=Nitrospirillum iridis TaxID=765888 RepID=A0A7X0AVW8_9PROT|nr:sigma 54-interacting transcriptional regulator [Nitrospirillum iridis]MBB6251073.1 two-component system nitrogen regulation response regulator GlnG [Nitrospirillum iridis]
MQTTWHQGDATASPTLQGPAPWNGQDHAVACLGVVWHPDPGMIGMITPLSAGGAGGTFALNRFEPLFRSADGREQRALDDRHISRQPLHIRRRGAGTFDITPPDSRMTVSVNGRPVTGPTTASLDELGTDILICLSDSVILSIFEATLPLRTEAAKHGLIGISRAVQGAWALVRQAAPTNLPVFLSGPTGTGKELVASALHALSMRAGQRLHTVNMATLSPALAHAELFGATAGAYTGATRERAGLFALADGATLFMDEVGDTPKEVQPMLLRALECGEYRKLGDSRNQKADVRVISATDRALDDAGFNQPLRRRLEGVVITLAPLCERRVDIGPLLRHFLTREEAYLPPHDPATLSAARVLSLLLHPWPGNIRELIGVARQIRLGTPVTLSRAAAPSAAATGANERGGDAPRAPSSATRSAERKHRDPATVDQAELVAALDASGWNVKAAAELLDLSRTSLYRLMERWSILQDIEDIPEERIRDVMRRHPGDMDAWVQDLKVPKDSLKRYLRRIDGR